MAEKEEQTPPVGKSRVRIEDTFKFLSGKRRRSNFLNCWGGENKLYDHCKERYLIACLCPCAQLRAVNV